MTVTVVHGLGIILLQYKSNGFAKFLFLPHPGFSFGKINHNWPWNNTTKHDSSLDIVKGSYICTVLWCITHIQCPLPSWTHPSSCQLPNVVIQGQSTTGTSLSRHGMLPVAGAPWFGIPESSLEHTSSSSPVGHVLSLVQPVTSFLN